MQRRSSRWATALVVAVILLAALAVRLAPYERARADGGWVLVDGNSYYQLVRIEQTIARGGRVPMFDAELAYPDGRRLQWHAGYTLPLTGAVVVVCGASPARACLEDVAVWSTPVLGVLATLLVLLLGLAVVGRAGGLIAGALFALYPFSAGSAVIGLVDHHVLEPLLAAAWLHCLVRGRALCAGLLAGVSFAVFPSALLPVGATVVALAGWRLVALRGGYQRDWSATRFTVAAFVVVIPLVFTGAFGDRIEPSATSLFHLLAMGAAAVGVVAGELVAGRARRRAALAAIGVYAGAAALFIGSSASALGTLLRFGRTEGLWSGVVQQVHLGAGPTSTALLLVLVTVLCAAVARGAARRDDRALALVALASWPLALAGVWQIRFLMVASAPLTVLIAAALVGVHRALGPGLADQPARVRWIGRALTIALALLALAPLREYAVPAPTSRTRTARDAVRLLRRLGQREHGDFSVLSHWTWGHYIQYLARMPVVACNFELSGHDAANVEARRALLADRPEQLEAIMARRRSKYLLISGSHESSPVARSGPGPHAGPAARLLARRDITRWGRLRLVDQQGSIRLFELETGR